MGKKALIAMSGGVDSSVAAFLTKQAGYNCIGVTMKLFQNEDIGVSRAKTCCSLDDVEDARSVARRLGIPYYVFNYSRNFKAQVIHLSAPMRVYAKIRYRQTEQSATAYPDESGKIRLLFDKLQRAITAGQAVVLYDGDTVVGGGMIC